MHFNFTSFKAFYDYVRGVVPAPAVVSGFASTTAS